MALQPHGPAPYTTSASVVTVLDAWRDRGLGLPLTTEVLVRAGVPESLARRTFQSLIALELFRDDGSPTEQSQDFRATRGEDEYRSRLQEWLRGVYADVLQYADPSTDSYERVAEAFRTYEPAGQRRAMASLLLGLWKYAGLPVVAGVATTNGRPSRTVGRKPRAVSRSAPSGSSNRRKVSSASSVVQTGTNDLPPALVGLLRQIPTGGRGWTEDTRNHFLTAFTAVLDFTVPIRPVGLEDLTDEDLVESDEPEDES